MKKYDIAIIGGGVAGCAAAAHLVGLTDKKIVLLERSDRLGKKLSATGNGQGNITNTAVSIDKYFGGGRSIVESIVGRDYRKALKLFSGIFVSDSVGRVYPASRQASSLTDELRRVIAKSNVEVRFNSKVISVSSSGTLTLESGESLNADKIIICTGGKAQKQFGTDGSGYALAEKLGHKITPLYPVLVQLKTNTNDIKPLKGIRQECEVTATEKGNILATVRGDVIFTEYGVTGNAIFTVSSFVVGKSGVKVSISFLPDIAEHEIAEDIVKKQKKGYERTELLACTLNNQLSRVIINRAKSGNAYEIAHIVKNFELEVLGTLGFDNAQVTRGGVSMNEVTNELQSKKAANIYFAGEILDVDGQCGGYNLHWALTSAERVCEAIKRDICWKK